MDVITITPSEWDKMVANTTDMIRWIKEAVNQLHYYRGDKAP